MMLWILVGGCIAWFLILVMSMFALSGFHAEKERERMRQRTIQQDIDEVLRELDKGGRNGHL